MCAVSVKLWRRLRLRRQRPAPVLQLVAPIVWLVLCARTIICGAAVQNYCSSSNNKSCGYASYENWLPRKRMAIDVSLVGVNEHVSMALPHWPSSRWQRGHRCFFWCHFMWIRPSQPLAIISLNSPHSARPHAEKIWWASSIVRGVRVVRGAPRISIAVFIFMWHLSSKILLYRRIWLTSPITPPIGRNRRRPLS